MYKGENYMFNEMLEKYKAFKSKKISGYLWVRIISMFIGFVVAIIANYLDSLPSKIIFAIIGIVLILVPSIGMLISVHKAENDNNNLDIDTYMERKKDFEKFLSDNGFDTDEKREWLKKICLERLNEGKRDEKIIMPFVISLVVPIILIIAEIVLNKKTQVFDYIALVWLLIFFIYYICFRLIDSELEKYINRDFYQIKRFKEDFDNLAFFELNQAVEEGIEQNLSNNDEQI